MHASSTSPRPRRTSRSTIKRLDQARLALTRAPGSVTALFAGALPLSLCVGFLTLATHAQAGSQLTWQNPGIFGLAWFSTASNWTSTGPNPVPSANDSLIFSHASGKSIWNDTSVTSFYMITFASGAGAYTLNSHLSNSPENGYALFVENNSANTQAIAGNLSIATGKIVLNANTANLDIQPYGMAGANFTATLNDGFLDVGGAHDTQFGLLFVSGGIRKEDAGTLTLTGGGTLTKGLNIAGTGITNLGTATVTGGTNSMTGGTLNLGVAGALNGATANTIGSGSTINFNGYDQTMRGLGGLGSTINLGGATLTTTGAGDSFSGAINGTGNLVHSSGTLTLSGANSRTGTTTVNGGRLVVGSASLPTDATVVVNSGATLAVGNTSAFGSLTGAGTVELPGGTLTIGGGDVSSTFSGAFTTFTTATGASLAKAGTGTFTFTGTAFAATTATTTLKVNGGTFRVGANNALGGKLNLAVASGATLDLGGFAVGTVGEISGAGAIALGGSSLTSTVATSSLFSGAISGGGSFGKAGAGTLTLSGANSYTGATSVLAGNLRIGNGGASGSLASGAVSLGAGTELIFSRTDTSTFAGAINGAGLLRQDFSGTGKTILTGAASHTGGTIIDNGTLQIGNGGATGSLAGGVSLADSASRLAFDLSGAQTLTNAISGTGGLTNEGAGQLTFTGPLSFTGPITVNGAGFIRLMTGYSNPGSLVKNGPGTLTLQGATSSTNEIQVNGGTLRIGSTAGASLTGNVLLAAAGTVLNFNNGANLTYAGGIRGTGGFLKEGAFNTTLSGALSYSGPTTISGGTLTFNPSGDAYLTGAVSGAGTLAKLGSTKLTLGNGITTAATTISAGALEVSGTALSGNVAISSGAQLAIFQPTAATYSAVFSGAGALAISGPITLTGNQGGFTGPISLGSGGLTLNPSADYTLASVISGNSNQLTKSGASTVTLTGNSGATSPLIVNAGTLRIGNGGTTGSYAGSANIASGATLHFDRTDNSSFSSGSNNGISGSGNIVKSGAGTLTIGGDLTQSGTTTINGGVISVGGTGNTFTWPSALSGAGGLAKNGAGTLTLSTIPAYTGPTTISGGQLTLGVNGTMNYAGAIDGGGALRIGNANARVILTGDGSQFTGPTTVATGWLTLGGGGTTGGLGGPLTVFDRLIFNRSDAQTLGNAISGDGAVQQSGSGNVTLNSTSGFSGTYDVTGSGSLMIGGASTPFKTKTGAGLLIVNTAVSNGVTVSGGTLQIGNGGTSGSVAGQITLGTSATVAFNRGDAYTYTNTIKGLAGRVVQSGAGTLTLANTGNNYGGGTTLNAGTLAIAADPALGGTSGGLTFNGGALRFTASANLADTRILTLNAGGGTFEIDPTFSTTISQSIGGAGGLTKTGAGTLILSGFNGYDGATTINGGILRLGANGTLGDSGLVNIGAAGTLDLAGRTLLNTRITGAGGITLGGGSLTLGADNADTTFSGTIANAGALTKTGTGTLTLGGNNSFGGGLTLGNGTLAIGSATALGTGTLTVNGGSLVMASNSDLTVANPITLGANLTFAARGTGVDGVLAFSGPVALTGDRTITTHDFPMFTGVISGAHSLTITGGGLLILGGDNTFSGGLTVSAGNTLVLDHNHAAGTGTLALNDAKLQPFSNSLTLANPLALTGRSTITSNDAMGGPGATVTLNGQVSGTGTLVVSGAGTLVLPGANVHSGGVELSGGTLRLGHDQALGTGTFTWNGGALDPTAARTLANAITLGQVVSVGGDQNLTLTGNITGVGGFTKAGVSTLTLGGANTYTGTTSVNDGRLVVNGSLANTAVNVAAGATLGGGGTLGGLATIGGGAHLAPGNSPGTLTFTSGLALDVGAILDFELGTTSDLIVVSGGTLSGPSSGTITLNLTDSGGFSAGIYTLIDATGAGLSSIGATSFHLGTTIPGYNYAFGQDGNHFQLIASAIPEPSTYASLAGLAALAVFSTRRRRA